MSWFSLTCQFSVKIFPPQWYWNTTDQIRALSTVLCSHSVFFYFMLLFKIFSRLIEKLVYLCCSLIVTFKQLNVLFRLARETFVVHLVQVNPKNQFVGNTLAIHLCSENANPFENLHLKSSTVASCPGVLCAQISCTFIIFPGSNTVIQQFPGSDNNRSVDNNPFSHSLIIYHYTSIPVGILKKSLSWVLVL